MLQIRDSELASVLGDEQLRSLGFFLNARGRWLRKHAPSPTTRSRGGPSSPRRAGITKWHQCLHVPGAPPMPPNLEPMAHLPAELRLEIVNELGSADMLALRRAYPGAFGFIYGEDARYQRLYILETLVVRKAERSLWWAEGAGAASPKSLAADRRRLEQLKRAVRPKRKSLLQYAVEKGYPADDIDALVSAYQESNINLVDHLSLKGAGKGRRGRPVQMPSASSKPRSC